jgi:flagellar FliL protein
MAEKDEARVAPRGKGKFLIFGSIGLVVVVASAAVTSFFLPGTSSGEDGAEGKKTQQAKEKPKGPESWGEGTVELTDILVNLAGTSGRRYLKMALMLEFKAPDPATIILQSEARKAELRDSLITLLSGKTLESLDGSDNKNLLKLEIIEHLGPILFENQKGRIEWVYYKDFLTQ